MKHTDTFDTTQYVWILPTIMWPLSFCETFAEGQSANSLSLKCLAQYKTCIKCLPLWVLKCNQHTALARTPQQPRLHTRLANSPFRNVNMWNITWGPITYLPRYVLRHSNGTVTIEYSNIALFVSALLDHYTWIMCWTHSSFWRHWFTFRVSANTQAPESEMLFWLRLQNVEDM